MINKDKKYFTSQCKGKTFFTPQCKGKKYFAPTKLRLYFIITMSVYLLMVFITIPTLNRLANGLDIIDVLPFYDGEYVVRLLEYLESEGRHYYLYRQIPLDMLYPLLYAFTYGQILKHFIDTLNLKRIKWVVFLPILAAVIDSLFTDLQPTLNRQMQATKYGNALNYIFLTCEFSFADDAWVKTNFIIADTDNKLTSQKAWELLHERFSAEEIEEHRYFLRNRFEIGGLRKDTGKAEIIFHFEKEFSDLCHREQKQKISEYFLTALRVFAQKQKKINYNFELMLADFERIVKDWQK